MQVITLSFTSAALVRFRAWLVAASFLLRAFGPGDAFAQASQRAYYSTGSNTVQVTQASPFVVGGATVTGEANAADGDFATYATLSTDIRANVGVPVGLRLKLTGTAPAGHRAGVLIANATTLLNLQTLGTVTLRTYLSGATPELREEKVVRAELVRAALLATDQPTQLEFLSSKSFDAVEIVIGALVSTPAYKANVYYGYGVQPGVQTRANGYISRFAAPAINSEYSASTTSGLLCVNTDVTAPERVADADLTNFATLKSTLTVACNPGLRTKLAGVPAGGVLGGYYAGFVIGQSSVLDVGVLSGLEITTYLGNTVVETRSGLNLLNLALLPGNKAQVSFKTALGKEFDGVKIQRVGLLTALDDLEVYYGFGLAPQAFEGTNPVLSDFPAPGPTNNVDYFASGPQKVSVDVNLTVGIITTKVSGQLLTISSVDNPEKAADANIPTGIGTSDYAQLNTLGVNLGSLNLLGTVTLATPITTAATASLKLKINGTGRAGNRVGFVVSQGAGLLDLTALERLTIATYDANNNLIETKTGSSLLSVILPGSPDMAKVSFLASRDFTYAQLTVTSAASVLSNTRVYYAFAEDVPLLFLAAPLPVELTAFTGRWAGGAAELNWATATEKNSSHFVVERSVGGDAAFRAVGQVEAAGTSSSPKTYQLRDAEAGTLGVPTLYYRLRQVDKDGAQAFSPLVAVVVGKLVAAGPQLEVYPNPAPESRTVLVHCPGLPATGGTVQTYSEMGQLVSQQVITEPTTRLSLPTLTPGLYHVVLRDATGQQLATQRLVVGGR